MHRPAVLATILPDRLALRLDVRLGPLVADEAEAHLLDVVALGGA
jgi:hypothetical protein